MSMRPKALVLNAPGINCNQETGFAVEQAGADAEQVHITQLRAGEKTFDDYQILLLSGGFSYGDDIASGRVLGLELRKQFPEELNRFVAAGKAVVGICNGFQVLVESGLLPDGEISEERNKRVALVHNQNNTFECRWNNVLVGKSVCKFIGEEQTGGIVRLPSAHGEGLFLQGASDNLEDKGQVVLSYCDDSGNPTELYPDNPNGSPGGVTGICNSAGSVLGMMPHPERAINKIQHPNWRRGEGATPFGAVLFKGLVNYAKEL